MEGGREVEREREGGLSVQLTRCEAFIEPSHRIMIQLSLAQYTKLKRKKKWILMVTEIVMGRGEQRCVRLSSDH